jgi:chymotrypsin
MAQRLQAFGTSCLALLLSSIGAAHAIVTRHDVPASEYVVPESDFPALADLPQEGHGVLIGDQWVVTAAHATQGRDITEVMINNKPRAVAGVIVHPGYRSLAGVPTNGDAAPVIAVLSQSDDIALIRLARPVTDIAPVPINRMPDEIGRLVTIYGKGASGDGLSGQDMQSPHRTVLRRAYNQVASADGRWLSVQFDRPPEAHALEGMSGGGDSGGPLLIERDGAWTLAGLTSWQFVRGDLSAFQPGHYGQVSYQVRLSHYADWIDSVIAAHQDRRGRKRLNVSPRRFRLTQRCIHT